MKIFAPVATALESDQVDKVVHATLAKALVSKKMRCLKKKLYVIPVMAMAL